jgi:ribosome-binding factor A
MSERTNQVSQLLKEEIGGYLQEHLATHQGVLTITAVQTTSDLRTATVWFGYFGEDLGTVMKELRKNQRSLQTYINKRLSMKSVPKITLKYDKSGDYAVEISRIINEAKHEGNNRGN